MVRGPTPTKNVHDQKNFSLLMTDYLRASGPSEEIALRMSGSGGSNTHTRLAIRRYIKSPQRLPIYNLTCSAMHGSIRSSV